MSLPIHSTGTACFQREPLTVRLRNLIHDYPEGVGIVKELIQNADDAGAKRIHITFDWRQHPTSGLPDSRMEALMGAAMVVYNDSTFSDEDFDNIQSLGESGKRETLWKTGRFGVGFNSVYHVTDYPSFISRDRIVFFDPHATAIPGTTLGEPGRSWLLADNWWDYPNFMEVYAPGGLTQGATNFNGTIFRLPLRTPKQAICSKIRTQPFLRSENVEPLLADLSRMGEEFLIFLKSVIEITVCSIESDGIKRELLSITTTNAKEVIEQREQLQVVLKQSPADFWAMCQNRPSELPSISYRHQIQTITPENAITSDWRVVGMLRVDGQQQVLDIIQELAEQKEKAVPWAGAAARISTHSTDGKARPFIGRTYCFLPLSESGFPIHINGFFDLDSSRTKLTSGSNLSGRDASRVRWNELLIKHTVAHACTKLVRDLVKDLGDTDTDLFYSLWAVDSVKDLALEQLSKYLLQLLYNLPVIRATPAGKWVSPSKVNLLATGREDLFTPLSADGLVFANPPLPARITAAFNQAELKLNYFSPQDLRNYLRQSKGLGCALENAPLPSLRQREWIYILLKHCLSDDHRDVIGLPLALLANDCLEVFGFQKHSAINIASSLIIDIFSCVSEWFLSEDLVKSFPILNQCNGTIEMTPTLVAKKLIEIIDEDTICAALQAGKSESPDLQWLMKVYQYFTDFAIDIPSELSEVPLVPGSDGQLHYGGLVETPLLSDRSGVNTEISQAITFFNILSVEAPTDLYTIVERFIEKHPGKFIRKLAVSDLIDVLAEREESSLPAYDRQYHQLLDWFTSNLAKIKSAESCKSKLRQLKIYPTTTDQLVSLTEENVYVLGAEDLPTIATDLHLLKLGDTSTVQTWQPLFEVLNIKVLDRATFIEFQLIPSYAHTSDEEQLATLAWIEDNYEPAIREIRKSNLERECKDEKIDKFERLIKETPLVRCQDGNLHPISKMYDPKEKIIEEILGELAPIPDINLYQKDLKGWLKFFRKLGMLNELSPQDLLDFVDRQILIARQSGGDVVAESCLKILEYLNSHWEKIENAQVENKDDKEKGLRLLDALKELAWLPVERSSEKLKRYPAASTPDDRLFTSTEVALWSNRYIIASQRPLLNPKKELNPKLKKALGLDFGIDNWHEVVAHLDKLIWEWSVTSDTSLLPNFNTSVQRVYIFLADKMIIDRHSNWLKEHFDAKLCLWDKDNTRFWQAKYTFENDSINRFNPWWTKLTPEKSEVRELFKVLGQKSIPDIDDYLGLLNEIGDDAKIGEPLGEDEINCSIELLYRINYESRDNPSLLQDRNLYLLTENGYLLDPADIMIPDAPWRIDSIREMEAVSILHSQVSTVLARQAGARSMARDVTEQTQGKFTVSHDKHAIEFCDLWANNIRSREFQHGLLRLLHEQNQQIRNIDLNWLDRVSITPTTNISTDLYLDNLQIASNVSGDSYYDREQSKFYLYYHNDRDIERNYLSEAINNTFRQTKLNNLSLLNLILDVLPNAIEEKLDKLKIPPLDLEIPAPRTENIACQIGDSIIQTEDLKFQSSETSELSEEAPVEDLDDEDRELDLSEDGDLETEEDLDSTQLVDSFDNSARELIDGSDYHNFEADNRGIHIERIDPTYSRTNSDRKLIGAIQQDREYRYYAPDVVEMRSQPGNEKTIFMDTSFQPYPEKALRDAVDDAGIARVLEYERNQGRFPQEKPHNNKGFDIISRDADGDPVRTIEVKSKQGEWDSVIVSLAQFEMALQKGEDFWLYVVERAFDDQHYQIYAIQNPARKINKFTYKSIWKEIADKNSLS